MYVCMLGACVLNQINFHHHIIFIHHGLTTPTTKTPHSPPPPPPLPTKTHKNNEMMDQARDYWAETKDAKGALALMPRFMTIETAALRALDAQGPQVSERVGGVRFRPAR